MMKLRPIAWIILLISVVIGCACGAANSIANSGPKTPSTVQADNTANDKPPTDTPQPQAASQRDADYIAFEGGLRAYPAQLKVELDAWLLGAQTRPLEYLLVSPGGNTHESLFATGVSGLHLKRALEIILLEEGKEKRSGRGYLEKPLGDRVKLSVRFKHQRTNKETTVPVEQWLWDHQNKGHPKDVGFVFTGSFEQYRPELNRSLFEADMKGNLIALWRDAACVLDNDRDDAWIPDIYSPHPEADGIPDSQAGISPPVTLIFEPWTK
jgi:hypothetical protein